MRRSSTPLLLACLLALALPPALRAQPEPEILEDRRKLAQTGMQFLTVSVDARSAALADAVTVGIGSSVDMFYNPAGLALMQNALHVSLGQNQWLTDIGYNHASLAFRPLGGRYGTVGVSLVAVDYGELFETVRADNEQGFVDLGTYSPSALAVGVGYARSLTDRFAVGGNVKYVSQSAGASALRTGDDGSLVREDFSLSTVAVDFGVIYQTGFRSLALAMDIRNFSRELTYAEENFELPLVYQVGVSMDMMDFTALDRDTHAFVLSVDAAHPRSYVEQLRVGGEYTFLKLLSLRAGYVYPTDEQGINLGLGLHHRLSTVAFGFDYAYTEFGAFGTVHRIALQLGL